MADDAPISPADVEDLLARMDHAAKAYISGDHRRYFELFDHGLDYSLMPPTGGPTRHGFDRTDEDIAEGARSFSSGEAVLDVEQTYVSGNLVVLVAVERQHGVVGDLPDQDLSLRITMVFRREHGRWSIVHRHADGLVREIPFDVFARLARGDVAR